MPKRYHPPTTEDFDEALRKFPHLKEHVDSMSKEIGTPLFVTALQKSYGSEELPNYIYPVGDPIFIHIYRRGKEQIKYHVVEPKIGGKDVEIYSEVLNRLVEIGNVLPVPINILEMDKVLIELYNMVVEIVEDSKNDNPLMKLVKKLVDPKKKIPVTQDQYEIIKYFLLRNRIGYGKLEPLFNDPYIEDIHCTGVGAIHLIHKVFEMVETSIVFQDDLELNKYLIEVSERVERPVSDAHAVVDAIMPDGSRVNFIYSRAVSLEGSSFTVRKFSEVPVSITQVVNWGTMSAQVAAYMWLCLENGMNVFVCGETASGKTTSLNAMCTFIKPDDKIYTVENTPEVTMPHNTWQHLVTREAGKSSDVTYLDLLIAALRSRPNYIIVGEIRGVEGNIAFQAMQTGHPVMSTFHAGNVQTMIQRLNGEPIKIPKAFMNNLNVVLIQMAVFHGGHFLRRVLSVTEIERYYDPEDKVITREVFSWNPVTDVHEFKGMYNSYILESKIARMRGYSDTRLIYDELAKREHLIKVMIKHKIFNYFDVWEVLKNMYYGGESTLPFDPNEPLGEE
ncbi:type II/IV secretion system ATPase subunit [Candidatus Woesearchaeota archaeon]|nr:type II/IV secretion system ATPase subunit [Candidatus Woesearchaeota archaeon]